MSRRRNFVLATLFVAGAIISLFFVSTERVKPGSTSFDPQKPWVAPGAVASNAAVASEPRVRIEASSSQPADGQQRDVIAAFWHYVNGIRGCNSASERMLRVELPATVLKAMPADELQKLGVLALDEVAFSVKVTLKARGKAFDAPIELRHALMEIWRQHDYSGQLELACGQLFDQTVGPGLVVADPALTKLACSLLAYWGNTPERAAWIMTASRTVLLAVRPDDKINPNSLEYLLLLLGGIDASTPELQQSLLGVIDFPVVKREEYLAGLYLWWRIGSHWKEWKEPIALLLKHPYIQVRRAAVEAVRTCAAPRGSSAQRVSPEDVFAAIPRELYFVEEGATRKAVIELIATFGGKSGEELLKGLLESNEPKVDKSSILSFLALAGKLSSSDCQRHLQAESAELRISAIGALAALASQGRREAREALAELAVSSNRELKLLAADSLARIPGGSSDALYVLLDSEEPALARGAAERISLLPKPDIDRLHHAAAGSPDADVRRAAATALLLRDPSSRADVLQLMQQDPDPSINMAGWISEGFIAFSQRDSDAIARWESTAPPSNAGASLTTHAAKREILSRVRAYQSPEHLETLAGINGFIAESQGLGQDLAALEDLYRLSNLIDALRAASTSK